jgi:hypothetical protein
MKKKATKKQHLQQEPEIKKHLTYELSLTKFELLHLRDLMGVLLPPDGAQTLSQSLALAEDRQLIESMLWDKVGRLCKQAKLPLDAEAPDYIVAPTAPPPMSVFQVNQDLQSQSNKLENAGFLPEEVLQDQEESVN